MIRLLYIPVTFKNILLAISGAKFWMYLLCLVLDCLAFGSLFTLIGIRLITFDASTKKKTFAQMSLVEKFNLILTYLLILLTIFTVATIAVYTKFKLEQLETIRQDRQLDLQNSIPITRSPDQIFELHGIDSNARKFESVNLLRETGREY